MNQVWWRLRLGLLIATALLLQGCASLKGTDPTDPLEPLNRKVTAFNDMAASIEAQIHQLENLSLVQQRFVSDVSHELRTPLTPVRMASDVLFESRGTFDPATARAAELLSTQIERFEILLADLLEISRYDAGAVG